MKCLIFLLLLISPGKSDIYDKNLTDFSKCKIHYSRSESAYTKFFQISEEQRTNELEFDFHFSVLAPSDAHILIAPSSKLTRQDPVYEIVLGAGSNSFSDIRRSQKSLVKQSKRTKEILSRLDLRSFWLHISKEGLIEVGWETEELAFLSWRDPDPLPVQVFSFSTWPGIEAKWLFDCHRDGNTSGSEEVPKEVSNNERLRNSILSMYDRYSRPILDENDLMEINVKFLYEGISLHERKSKMFVRGIMFLRWKDEKVSWDPNKYENLSILHLPFTDLWSPNLDVFNSASGTASNFLKSTLMKVDQNGWVTWKTSTEMEVWCDASGIGSENWPKDQHTCEIQFGFLTQKNKFVIHTELISKLEDSEWEVLNVASGPIYDDSETGTSVIVFKIRRYPNFYTAIYYAPLITISFSMLLSFCLPVTNSGRIGLNCLQLLLLCVFMANLSLKVPQSSTKLPYIITLYSNGVIAAVISLGVTIFVTNLTAVPRKKPLPQILYKLFTSYYFKTFISFGFLSASESYDNLVGEISSSSKVHAQETWRMLGRIIDRLMFVVYSLIFAICMFRSY